MSFGDSIRKCSVFCLLAISFQALGCSGTDAPAPEVLVPVAGTVTMDGKPAAGISLFFFPSDSSPTRGGSGKTDEHGGFEIIHNVKNEPGIPAGAYTVIYSKFALPDGSPVPEGKMPADVGAIQSLPPLWSDMTKAGKHNQVVVPADGVSTLDLKIDTKLKG